VLGLDLARVPSPVPPQAQQLLEERQQARDAKDFARSDRLRDELASLGVVVIDTPEGQKIRR
jgi:cysteinyl-tRNA synthetase